MCLKRSSLTIVLECLTYVVVSWCVVSKLKASWILVWNQKHPFMIGFICLQYVCYCEVPKRIEYGPKRITRVMIWDATIACKSLLCLWFVQYQCWYSSNTIWIYQTQRHMWNIKFRYEILISLLSSLTRFDMFRDIHTHETSHPQHRYSEVKISPVVYSIWSCSAWYHNKVAKTNRKSTPSLDIAKLILECVSAVHVVLRLCDVLQIVGLSDIETHLVLDKIL